MDFSGSLIKAIYDYRANDSKVLDCSVGERFLIIKQVGSQSDWLYVVNCRGKLGYIPANYTQPDHLDDHQFLEMINKIIAVLDSDHNDPKVITIRQINHAQVNLTQLRCEVINRLYSNSSLADSAINAPSETECQALPVDKGEISKSCPSVKNYREFGVQTSILEESSPLPSEQQKEAITNIEQQSSDLCKQEVSLNFDNMAVELIEKVRVSTELSHEMCKLAILTVINFLNSRIPAMEKLFANLLEALASADQSLSSQIMKNSSDLIRLSSLFQKLRQCKEDIQQRGWPINDDEEIELSLIELVKLLANANPTICRQVMLANDHENVQLIVSYFSMETKRSLKMQLYSILMEIIRLMDDDMEDNLILTVLPTSLVNEMLDHTDDVERWCKASVLFTYSFGSGQKLPVNIYENINENFIEKMVSLIEGDDIKEGENDRSITPEMSIPPLLAFNLHFDETESNLVLRVLKKRKSTKNLIENILSYLNWEEDPTLLVNYFGAHKKTKSSRPDAVHKLLVELFKDDQLAKLFYYNDLKVIIDILITHLTNQQQYCSRESYFNLLRYVTRNPTFLEEPYKVDEIKSCLDGMKNNETISDGERNDIKELRESLEKSFSV